MMTEMKLPACYAVIDENEMTYLDGGATIADSDAYKAFLNVGQVFNQLARIFSGASSIINNINVIYKSIVELNNLLGGFIKKLTFCRKKSTLFSAQGALFAQPEEFCVRFSKNIF